MSLESSMEQVESTHFLRRHPDEAVVGEQDGTSDTVAVPTSATRTDGGASVQIEGGPDPPLNDDRCRVPATGSATDPTTVESSSKKQTVDRGSTPLRTKDGSSSSNNNGNNGNNKRNQQQQSGGGGGAVTSAVSGTSRRKRRRRKSKRGKSSSTNVSYSRTTQWKYHSSNNERRVKYLLAAARRYSPFMQSDHPPLVPYNTNRFLMEDHMPQVLTPSEDEEDFLTKDFSVVYEKERCEQLENLSHPELIQEYIKLMVDHEQVTRRLNALSAGGVGSGRGIASATALATVDKSEPDGGDSVGGGAGGSGASEPDGGSISKERRLELRVQELTKENYELRRQLEHTNRLVLSAKSSPRYGAPVLERMDVTGGGDAQRIDDSTSEDSEADSSSTTSSNNSGKSSSSSSSSSSSASSMSEPENDEPMAVEAPSQQPRLMAGASRQSVAYRHMNGGGVNGMANGNHGEVDGEDDPSSSDDAADDDNEDDLIGDEQLRFVNGEENPALSPRPPLMVE
uniref:Putative hexamethylene bis-acetamide-inducible protein n=1 Tax=Anopheles marajoara TaxID=58244 RepID=A0A2M4BKJ4_9DIPT